MSKVNFEHIKGNSHFATGVFSVGMFTLDQTAILIDSGTDDFAKNLYLGLQESGYDVHAIINTHCHPDHSGGNHFFQKKNLNLRVYATYNEKLFIEDPLLAPRCFCANAAPLSGLKNKFIAPQNESQVTDILTFNDGETTIKGATLAIITLPGHTPGSIGILSPDNVLYCGDALFGQTTFDKHPILFYTDIEKTLASFEKLSSLNVQACVLYHGGVTYDLPAITRQHTERILEIKDAIFNIIKKEPLAIDLLTQQIMQRHKIPNNLVSFTLTQTTIRAYLTKLEKEKAVEMTVKNGLLLAVPLY